MKNIYLTFIILVCIYTCFTSCERDNDIELTTISVVNERFTPSYTSAGVRCRFSTDATLRNVCLQYSLTSDFTEHEEVAMWESDGSYHASLENLQDNTAYYIRYSVSNRFSSVIVNDVSQLNTLQPSVPTISIDSIGDIWDTHAKAFVNLSFDGGATISKMGICWSTQPNVSLQDNKKEAQTVASVFDMTSLQPNTTYYVRAYAENKKGISYSDEKNFITLSLPQVQTNEVKNVQSGSAELSGTLLFDGNDASIIKGFCWSNKSAPTLDDTYVIVSTDETTFTHQLNNLLGETTYYVRAFAKSKISVVYGDEKMFLTSPATLPIIKTNGVNSVTYTSASISSSIISTGGSHISECGVVYNTSGNPTISDEKMLASVNIGTHLYNLDNLQTGTTYHARVYAINAIGIAYGEEVSFTTLDGFSISNNKKIIFSPGNLQYHPKNKKWRFANSQLDYIGDANSKMTNTYDGWIDLFGWGTGDIPLCLYIPDCRDRYTFVDWGTNTIGSYAPNTWRTLTYSEWDYLLQTRADASKLLGIAQVAGVNGLILLPDNWKCPTNITFQSGFHILRGESYFEDYQIFSASEWKLLESIGAVFLPAAGRRSFTYVNGIKTPRVSQVQSSGRYWSSTYYEQMGFDSEEVTLWEYDPNDGNSVRLVKEL